MTSMKQIAVLAAAAAAAMAGAAQAADVQIYGRVDAGLRYTHSNNEDTLELYSGNRSTNRVGFNIVEDLGNGMKVKAYLENGFKIDTGSLGTSNTLFDRRSILAVQGSWGELAMGRMGTVHSTVAPYTMGLIKYDPFGTSYGNASIGKTFANSSRVNNAVTWVSPSWSGWKVGATYSLGDASDETYTTYADRDHTLALATDYTGKDLYLSLSYATIHYGDKEKNVSKDVKLEGETESKNHKTPMTDNAQLIAFGGWYRFLPEARVFFGAQYQKHWEKAASVGFSALMNTKSHDTEEFDRLTGGYDGYSLLLGGDYIVGQHKVIVGAQYFDGDLSKDSSMDYKYTVLAAAYEYKLAKTTWFYVAATHSMASGELEKVLSKAGDSEEATQFMVGINYNF